MKTSTLAIVGAAAAVAAVYLITRAARSAATLLEHPEDMGAAVGAGVVNAGAGVVLGIGDAVGLPRTDMNQCQRAMAEGRTWDASMVCPAPVFLDYLTTPRSDVPTVLTGNGAQGGW